MYKLVKAKGLHRYFVVGEDGMVHSKMPLALDVAKRQMIALNIAHARKMGHEIPLLPAKKH
jgi:hypothetical protein